MKKNIYFLLGLSILFLTQSLTLGQVSELKETNFERTLFEKAQKVGLIKTKQTASNPITQIEFIVYLSRLLKITNEQPKQPSTVTRHDDLSLPKWAVTSFQNVQNKLGDLEPFYLEEVSPKKNLTRLELAVFIDSYSHVNEEPKNETKLSDSQKKSKLDHLIKLGIIKPSNSTNITKYEAGQVLLKAANYKHQLKKKQKQLDKTLKKSKDLLKKLAVIENNLDLSMDDFDAIEKQEEIEGKSDFWDKHLSGYAGTLYQAGSNRQKMGAVLRVDYQQDFKLADVNLQTDLMYISLKNRYVAETKTLVENGDYSHHEYDEYKFTHTDRNILFDLREAYLSKKMGKNHLFSAGRQIIVWGQFDIFSTIDFVLPIQMDKRGMSLNKADNRMPQDLIKYSYYPKPNVEVSAYYFPYTRYSEFTRFISKVEDHYDDYYFVEGDHLRWGEEKKRKALPEKSDTPASGLRVMFYPKWLTVGVTYFNGLDFYPFEKKSIKKETFNNIRNNRGELGSVTVYDENIDEIEVMPVTMLGLEMSKPIGNTTYKLELSRKKAFREISGVDGVKKVEDLSEKRQELYNWVINKNDRKTYIPSYWDSIGIGIDGNYNWGVLNFYAIYMRGTTPKKYSDVEDMEKALGSRTSFDLPLGGFNVGKYIGSSKKKIVGFAFGLLSGSLGASIYYGQEFKESWKVAISLEAIQYLSDIEYQQDKWVDSPIDPSLSIGLSRQF